MTLVRLTSGLLLSLLITTHCLAADQNAVVFMYHRFGESDFPATNIRLDQFDQHLALLEQGGYQVWPLEKIIDHLRNNQPLPDNTVAITVDDAYRSIYTEAYPRLKKRGWPFTVFVSTDVIDQKLPAYMSWDQMREMRQHQVTFANHSASHDFLIRKQAGESLQDWNRRITGDIKRAQARIEKELGKAPMLFAYPYGEYNEALANIITQLGYTGFGQHSGAIGPHSDLRTLPRYPMAEAYADIREFKTKAASLALPVKTVKPWDPELDRDIQPEMEVSLAPSDARLDQLVCYVDGRKDVAVTWLDKDQRFIVRAKHPLPAGRSRYNCTAPSSQPGRYYWFSHLWIRQAEMNSTPSERQ